MASKPSLCFMCDQNPRIDGECLCRSCKEEHPFCYECGQRKRNLPFKLCTKCYQEQRKRAGHAVGHLVVPPPTSTASTAVTPQTSDVLLKLRSDQNTYKEIEEHFQKEWVKVTKECPKAPPINAIFAIQNQELGRKFQRYGQELRKQTPTLKSSNSDLFFHGTKLNCDLLTTSVCCSDSTCGICGISKQGFDKERIGTNIPRFQRFGKGIYLAPNSSKCHDYTQGNPSYGVRAQLLCLVACGAKCELMQNSTKLESPPENFHSVHGKAGSGGCLNYDEIVVFQAEAVLPQYVVVYELNGVDKIAK